MARTTRLKLIGEEAYYHLVSRAVGGEFLLGDTEKEKLLSIIKQFSSLYFVKVIGFCIMSSHFHLLVKTIDIAEIDDSDLKNRLVRYYKKTSNEIRGIDLIKHKEKLTDISEYMKSIKMTFSRWYNKRNNRKGYFWGDRFKSVLVESGESLLNMLAYIDLNAVRAKISDRPEEYRWSSISHRLAKNDDGFLCFDGTEIDNIQDYVSFVYRAGKVTKTDENSNLKGKIEEEAESSISIWQHKVRYFTDTLVIGSRSFIETAYNLFDGKINKKDRKAHKVPINLSEEIYSIRRLNTI